MSAEMRWSLLMVGLFLLYPISLAFAWYFRRLLKVLCS